jgi:hypothetical protein
MAASRGSAGGRVLAPVAFQRAAEGLPAEGLPAEPRQTFGRNDHAWSEADVAAPFG